MRNITIYNNMVIFAMFNVEHPKWIREMKIPFRKKCRIKLIGELDFKFSRLIFLKIKMTQQRAESSGVKARNQNFYDAFAPHVAIVES